jgi:hypothetical protein
VNNDGVRFSPGRISVVWYLAFERRMVRSRVREFGCFTAAKLSDNMLQRMRAAFVACLLSLLLVTSSRAEDPLTAFQILWKDSLAKTLANKPYFERLNHLVMEPGQVSARSSTSAEGLKRVSDTLTEKERRSLIVYGALKDLEPDRPVWTITNGGGIGAGFQAYVDQKSGKLIFLWLIPEG